MNSADTTPKPYTTNIIGDWDAHEPTPDAIFPATIIGNWNGWLVPVVDRDTANRIVARQQLLSADNPDNDQLSWDGDTLVHHQPTYEDEQGYAPTRVEPAADGTYCVSFDWCWVAAD